jgi:hypothetical protein
MSNKEIQEVQLSICFIFAQFVFFYVFLFSTSTTYLHCQANI